MAYLKEVLSGRTVQLNYANQFEKGGPPQAV